MSLHRTPFEDGDRVARISTVGRLDRARHWVLGTISGTANAGRLVTVRWDDTRCSLHHVDDLNIRHAHDVPAGEVDGPYAGEVTSRARHEAARRLLAALDVWPHADPWQRATLVGIARGLADQSFECIGCDATARVLLGMALVDVPAGGAQA